MSAEPRRLQHPTAPAPRGLPPDRRHRRVGHAGRRRQGQGAQGRGPAGDRLRRRRAGLPDPGLHRRRRGRGLPRPGEPPLHPGRRPARAQGGRSPPRRCATPATRSAPSQVLVTNGGKQAVYQAFATLLDPGDEVLLPAPYWTTYPEAIRLAGGTAGRGLRRRGPGLPGHRRAARGGPHPAHQGAAVLLAVQPDRRGLPARAGRAIGQWALEHGIWVITDEIYEHLIYDGATFVSMPVEVPELADTLRRAQRRRQDLRHDRLAGGLDDRPARRRQGRDQPAVARRRPTWPTSRSAPRSPRVTGDLAAVGEMRDGLRPPPADDRRHAQRDRRRRLPEPAGRVLRLPVGQGRARPDDPRPHADDVGRAGRR